MNYFFNIQDFIYDPQSVLLQSEGETSSVLQISDHFEYTTTTTVLNLIKCHWYNAFLIKRHAQYQINYNHQIKENQFLHVRN